MVFLLVAAQWTPVRKLADEVTVEGGDAAAGEPPAAVDELATDHSQPVMRPEQRSWGAKSEGLVAKGRGLVGRRHVSCVIDAYLIIRRPAAFAVIVAASFQSQTRRR
jgi:hypothetical protein